MKNRRSFLKKLSITSSLALIEPVQMLQAKAEQQQSATNEFAKPITVYINWASYDELSDKVKLDEKVAHKQLDELIRLRKQGVKLDYYLMDMFWFDPDGGYREWRKGSWTDAGIESWMSKCRQNDIKMGLWLSTNMLSIGSVKFLRVHEAWKDSLNRKGDAMCLFAGGYLQHLIQTMQIWYNKGITLFKFDFANFTAATPDVESTHLPQEIFELNTKAFATALKLFKVKNPDAKFVAYNGYGGEQWGTITYTRKLVDERWLQVFDALYCGDPRPSDVPTANFWRSKDIYSDQMVFQYLQNGIPLSRIDNTAFMIGNTGTCYNRGKSGWKAMLLLSLARGGWLNTYYGDLSLLSDEDARWFAQIQALFLPMQQYAKVSTFGTLPALLQPYGFMAENSFGALVTVVNPSQQVQTVDVPVLGASSKPMAVLFADKGFEPTCKAGKLRLGPEQVVLVGVDGFAAPRYNLGKGDFTEITKIIEPIGFNVVSSTTRQLTVEAVVPKGRTLQAVARQYKPDGLPLRSTAPNKQKMDTMLKVTASQNKQPIEGQMAYDKVIWSGLSWAVVRFSADKINHEQVVQVSFETTEPTNLTIDLKLYAIS